MPTTTSLSVKTRTLGIVAHSAEGGALCFLTACHEGEAAMGAHMHPSIVVSAIPMGLSMPAWEADEYGEVAKHLGEGVRQVADAGADFYVCPDNTAHIALEPIADSLPIPGLHIAQVVCSEAVKNGWTRIGLLGTKWTMNGAVYSRAMEQAGLERMIPDERAQAKINVSIFDELCQGVFTQATIEMYIRAIEDLKSRGAQCVILGCTEIPIIIDEKNSPLPVLDSTRLLAKYGVREALRERAVGDRKGWLTVEA